MTFELGEHEDHEVVLRPSLRIGAIIAPGDAQPTEVEYVSYCRDCDEVVD